MKGATAAHRKTARPTVSANESALQNSSAEIKRPGVPQDNSVSSLQSYNIKSKKSVTHLACKLAIKKLLCTQSMHICIC